jgi:hypothetical protein
MAKTAKRLAGPAQVSNAAATKYTAPASTTAVIRQVHIQNPSAAAVTFTMSIGADAAATRVFDAFSIPAASTYDWYGYVVVAAAEIVQAFAGTNNILTLTIFGDELTPG